LLPYGPRCGETPERSLLTSAEPARLFELELFELLGDDKVELLVEPLSARLLVELEEP
jgi:hypothetical protein